MSADPLKYGGKFGIVGTSFERHFSFVCTALEVPLGAFA